MDRSLLDEEDKDPDLNEVRKEYDSYHSRSGRS